MLDHKPSHLLLLITLILPALLLRHSAAAGVIDSSAAGFTIQTTVVVAAAPADAYRKLWGSIGEWWDPDHTYSGDSRNMSIGIGTDGCFCEKLENGGVVRHMTVLYSNPGKTLRLSGGLGPLQELAATGTLTWNLTPSGDGTAIEMTFSAAGYHPKGLGSMAPVFDQVLGRQMDRLKSYLDTGTPDAALTPKK